MNRRRDDDWARQVPTHRWEGPYDDYGWESGQSGLPEFRDLEVHRMPWDERYERSMRGIQTRADEERDYRKLFRDDPAWHVPGPFAGKGPRGYRRSDERIMEDVCERLTQHGQIDASDIEVEVHNGEVTLKGTVRDRRMKRMADDIADSVFGVNDVHNQLHLSGMPGSGAGRKDEVGRSGVWPASSVNEAPDDAQAQGMASWGQGERGAAGYDDSGESELNPGGENRETR